MQLSRPGLLAALAATVVSATACAPTNYVRNRGNTSVCTSAQLEEWRAVRDSSLGATGRDPVGHRIGFNPAYRAWVGMNWYPFDGYKQVVCGALHHFNFYDPWGDEADWNNFMIPTPPFASYLEDALSFADSDDVHNCAGTDDCMEAEITPDEHFYENPWFSKSSDTSTLEGRTICTYGAWVWEEAHGNRPEIHPSELYWWRERADGTGAYLLMIVQDDSNRFDRKGDFAGPDTRPDWWHPWSESPRRGTFRLPFEVTTTGPERPATIYAVSQRAARNVADETADADNGKDHALEYDKRIVVKVSEQQASDGAVGVGFSDLCRDDANRRLQGFLSLNTIVGKGDRGDEGYHVMRVTVGTEEPVVAPMVASGGIRLEGEASSLRRVVVDGQPQLVQDVRIFPVGEARPAVARVELDLGGRRASPELKPGGAAAGEGGRGVAPLATIVAVPAARGSQLEVTLEGGQKQTSRMPAAAVVPHAVRREAAPVRAEAGALAPVFEALHARPVRLPEGATAARHRDATVEIAPYYAPLRDGKPSKEDGGPMYRELNRAIQGGEAGRLAELFGSREPFKIEWTFAATDLRTGAAVLVRIGPGGPGEIGAEITAGRFPGSVARVTFPDRAQDAYEVVATATVSDVYGLRGKDSFRLGSHAVLAREPDPVIQLAAGLAGVSEDLVARSRANEPVASPDPAGRRARIVRAVASAAVADGSVSIEELRTLVRVARRAGGQ